MIDYRRGERIVSALLVGDADGRFHIAFVDPFLGVKGVGTKPAPQLYVAAERGVRALRDRDCEAFLEVAYRRFGLGGGTDTQVCERVDVTRSPTWPAAGTCASSGSAATRATRSRGFKPLTRTWS